MTVPFAVYLQTGGMTMTLPEEIERRLATALAEVQSLAVARGRQAAFASALRSAEESVRDALWWQSRGLAEHALREIQALSGELGRAPAVALPADGAVGTPGAVRGSCPAHLSARLKVVAGHVRHLAEERDVEGALKTEIDVLNRTVALALEADSQKAVESALRLVRVLAERIPAVQRTVARVPQFGEVGADEQPSTLGPADSGDL